MRISIQCMNVCRIVTNMSGIEYASSVLSKGVERTPINFTPKIFFNIQRGIWQGLYRDDVSTELVARRYISRLIDLHNPDNFPPEEFSFLLVEYSSPIRVVKNEMLFRFEAPGAGKMLVSCEFIF